MADAVPPISKLAESSRSSAEENLTPTEKKELDIEKSSIPVPADQLPSDAHDFPGDRGGYGWVIVACAFAQAVVTWGNNATFGVFLSFYLENDYFPGATPLQFAFVGGLSLSLAMAVGPVSNWLSKSYGHRVVMGIGAVLLAGGQIAAGFSTKLWHLIMTQGVCFGLGLGFLMVASAPIVSQWFGKRRALALGLQGAGSGAGGLLFANLTRVMIQKYSLKWALLTNGLISAAVLVPVTILMKSRSKPLKARFHPFQIELFKRSGFVSICLWGFFIQLAYATAIYSIPTYATQGIGLSQTDGSTLQSMLAAGQLVGRPLCGLLSDKIGRINGAAIVSVLAGLSCLFVWMFAHNFGVLGFFAILQGAFSGIFWISNNAVITEVIGIRDLSSGLSMVWLTIVAPATVSEAITIVLTEYSRNSLGRTGTSAYLIAIGFAGSMFTVSGLCLLGAKFYVQKNRKLWQKA